MSHVASIDLDVKDLKCLARAAERLGLELVEGKKTYKWYGYSTGTVPAGFTKDDLGKCDHALRVKGNSAAYEIGVCTARNGRPGYQLLWDSWEGGYGLETKVGEDMGLLKQAYSLEAAKKQALRDGLRVTEVVKANGNIVLTASR